MIITALLMGFIGSLHCIGMCSPLALAVSNLNPKVFLTRVFYNAGRILTYGILGLVITSVSWFTPLAQFQNLISIVIGVVLLVLAISGTTMLRIPLITPALHWFRNSLVRMFGTLLHQKKTSSTFLLGALNGLLPCGLTFLALTYCLTLDTPALGFSYMILFGIGTLPAMLGFVSVFQWTINRYHFSLKRITSATLLLSGVLLIARVFLFHGTHPSGEEHRIIDIVVCTSKP
jgi:hypothetical protein